MFYPPPAGRGKGEENLNRRIIYIAPTRVIWRTREGITAPIVGIELSQKIGEQSPGPPAIPSCIGHMYLAPPEAESMVDGASYGSQCFKHIIWISGRQ